MDDSGNTREIRGKPFTSERQPSKRRGVSLRSALKRELLKVMAEGGLTKGDALVGSTVDAAIGGDPSARKLVFEYTEGKPVQPVEASGPNGGPLKIIVEYVGGDS